MHTTGRFGVIGIATLLVFGSQLVAAHETDGTNAAGPAATVDHYLRSGFMSVSGSGEVARFSAINALGEDQQLTLSLVSPAGKVLVSKSAIVGPDKSMTINFDPSASTRVRAVVLATGEAGLLCDGFAPTLELLRSSNGTLRTAVVVDTFWHLDEPA